MSPQVASTALARIAGSPALKGGRGGGNYISVTRGIWKTFVSAIMFGPTGPFTNRDSRGSLPHIPHVHCAWCWGRGHALTPSLVGMGSF